MDKTCDKTGHGLKADIVETIPVSAQAGSYDVLIGTGLIGNLGTLIKDRLCRPYTVIITDENVAQIYLGAAMGSLDKSSIKAESIILPAGEKTKSFESLEFLTNSLLSKGVERTDTVIALGGGVIGDLVGFTASVLQRGINFIQVPTTLLAQVDSSVGGKTGINTPSGKNLVGAFHPPCLVLADLTSLDTLDRRQMNAGYAEIVKYGLIDDPDFFNWLTKNGNNVLGGDKDTQCKAVKTCILSKARIVAEDEFEQGRRALLNLGHTFAHALEAWAGYGGDLLHGEAVAIGLVLALDLSAELGLADRADVERLVSHLSSCGLKTSIHALSLSLGKDTDADTLIKLMGQDKKVKAGKITFIVGPIGAAAQKSDIDNETICRILQKSMAGTP